MLYCLLYFGLCCVFTLCVETCFKDVRKDFKIFSNSAQNLHTQFKDDLAPEKRTS